MKHLTEFALVAAAGIGFIIVICIVYGLGYMRGYQAELRRKKGEKL